MMIEDKDDAFVNRAEQLRKAFEESTQGKWNAAGKLDGCVDVGDGYLIAERVTPEDQRFIAIAHNLMPDILGLIHDVGYVLEMCEDLNIDLKSLRKGYENLIEEDLV